MFKETLRWHFSILYVLGVIIEEKDIKYGLFYGLNVPPTMMMLCEL